MGGEVLTLKGAAGEGLTPSAGGLRGDPLVELGIRFRPVDIVG